MARDRAIDYYWECFHTEVGKRVIASLLMESKFFEYTHTPEEQAVQNFVKTILFRAGAYPAGIKDKNIDLFVEKILSLPYRS